MDYFSQEKAQSMCFFFIFLFYEGLYAGVKAGWWGRIYSLLVFSTV